MGRSKKQIDEGALMKMRGERKTIKQISRQMGVSEPTISRRIAYLRHHKGILTKYRELQSLQLTQLQARILEAVDLTDIEATPLLELLQAFHVLKKAEKAIQGKEPSFKVRGLLQHLQALEKQE